MGILDVSPTQMTTDAEGFNRISTVSREIASYLEHSLSLLGNFWGNDRTGGDFLSQWDPSIRGLLDALTGIGDGMLETGNSLRTSAGLYEKANDVNTGLVR